jgi:hypothetical protein
MARLASHFYNASIRVTCGTGWFSQPARIELQPGASFTNPGYWSHYGTSSGTKCRWPTSKPTIPLSIASQVPPVPFSYGQSSFTTSSVTFSGTTMSTSVAFNNTGSQGDSDSLAVERALRTLHAAGYQIPDNLPMEESEDLPEYDSGTQSLSASIYLDGLVPLDVLRGDIRNRHPNMPVPPIIPQDKPTSLGLGLYTSKDCTVNSNLPLSPALSQWMEFHSSVLEGKGHPAGIYLRTPTRFTTLRISRSLFIHAPRVRGTDWQRW